MSDETVEQTTEEPAVAEEALGSAAQQALDAVLDVSVHATVEIGGTTLLVRELLQLDKGSVLELDRNSGDPADLMVNGRLVARGEVTVEDGRMAVKIVEVVSHDAARSG